jgi:hypothetical protein
VSKDVGVIDWDDWTEAKVEYLAKRRRQRKVTLTRALRDARKAGVPVASATITAEGVSLTFGQAPSETNPWLVDLDKATKQ